jgi:hypothetical protein
MQPAYNVRLPEALRLRTPRGLSAAISTAAKRYHMTSAEWARQVLLRSLHAEGLVLREEGEIERVEPAGVAR